MVVLEGWHRAVQAFCMPMNEDAGHDRGVGMKMGTWNLAKRPGSSHSTDLAVPHANCGLEEALLPTGFFT